MTKIFLPLSLFFYLTVFFSTTSYGDLQTNTPEPEIKSDIKGISTCGPGLFKIKNKSKRTSNVEKCAKEYKTFLDLNTSVKETQLLPLENFTNIILISNNPKPNLFPTIIVWESHPPDSDNKTTMVSVSFPNIPNFICDAWCYEGDLVLKEARNLRKGTIKLYHQCQAYPNIMVVTIIKPEPQALEISAHIEPIDPKQEIPSAMPFLNICWQFRRTPNFKSEQDNYQEFIMRCFIFTEKGLTFLDKTTRLKIPQLPEDHPMNNPYPWIQMYATIKNTIPPPSPDSWALYSPDRFTIPIIGVISRDKKYLAAIVSPSAKTVAQLWFHCLHSYPSWEPDHKPPLKKRWILKMYAMENDIDSLLKRVKKDFPTLSK